jgi:hypothetical protein
MKRGKKLTRKQREIIQDAGLNPCNWLLVKNLPDKLVLVHKEKGTLAEIKVFDGQAV